MTQDVINSAIDDAVRVVGSQAKLARAIGVTPVFVSQMRRGLRAVPPKLCTKIELATQRKVSRACLRPDVFGSLEGQIDQQSIPEVREAS
ncbi:transcriptional regulator [Microbulbifer sp. CnH-101-E]|uniref:transcriptional regulator n=1 Tax=unclassified Microbulbifer TaxID=2619833 RepID=UPI00403AE822